MNEQPVGNEPVGQHCVRADDHVPHARCSQFGTQSTHVLDVAIPAPTALTFAGSYDIPSREKRCARVRWMLYAPQ